MEEVAQLKILLTEQQERIRVLESLNHEERIKNLESMQLDKRIEQLESFNIEELITDIKALKTEEKTEATIATPPKCASCQSLIGNPYQSTPVVLSMPATPPSERANLSAFEQFTTQIVPQLPFVPEAVTMLTNILTNPVTVFGNQLPSPLSAAQSLSSLPPLKAISSFSKWLPNQSISSLSSSLMSSLTANRSSNSPSRNVGPSM